MDSVSLSRQGFICQFTYNLQIPGGDLAKRFGTGHAVGTGVYYKFKSNFILGAEGNYFFGAPLLEAGIFRNITDTNGFAVDRNGSQVFVDGQQRGFNLMIKGGKLIPFSKSKPNSGLLISAGIGYVEHYIRLSNLTQNIAALDGDKRFGYDRLCTGTMLNQFIGYQHLSNNLRINFFAGIELGQAFTTSKRTWDYDLKSADNTPRNDFFYNFRFGWLLPIYTGTSSPSQGYRFK